MDCHEIQALISESLDREPVDAAALEEAKQHCRRCADCATFVRGLSLARRAQLPAPDPALTDRVMAAVRAEAAAAQTAAQAAAAQAAAAASAAGMPAAYAGAAPGVETPGAYSPPAPDQVAAWEQPAAQRSGAGARTRPAVLAAWIAAAAVLFISAGTVGILGIRFMSQNGKTADTTTTLSEQSPAPAVGGTTVQGFVPPSAGSSSKGAAGSSESANAVPSFITSDDKVYKFVGVSDKVKASLTKVGSTTSSLDGGELKPRDVFQLNDTSTVYVENDKQEILEFKIVERTYQGRTYRLRSAALFAFGSWPTLPTDIAQPSSAEAGSAFIEVGPEPSGLKIYRLATSTPEQGIAVGPGSPSDDPAGGNPGWTWWTP